MPNRQRKLLSGRGSVGKVAVSGAKGRDTNRVTATVVEATDRETLQVVVVGNTTGDATDYTDEAKAYEGMPRVHEAVKHCVKEYVRGMAHTKGIM